MADLFSDLRELLSPRQRPTPVQNDDDGLTIIAVTTMTAPQTFDGDAILVTETPSLVAGGAIAGGAVFASRSSSDEAPAAATTAAIESSAVVAPVASTPLPTSNTNTIVNQGAFGVTSAASSASATSASDSSSSGGLSGGAKAGIAFGVLIPLAALLIGALILIRRKKQQQKDAGMKLDDEKTAMANAMPPSSFGSAPAPMQQSSSLAHAPVLPQVAPVRSTDSLTAPSLSLRPQSSFDPRMSAFNGPSSGGNGAAMAAGALGAGAAVGAAAIAAKRSPSPQQSAWERPGNEKNANDPANPFGNHAETVAMNNAAPAPQQQRIPSIDASDFPLPGSVAPSEKAISLAPMSTDNVSMAPPNPAAASTVSLATPSTPASSVGMAAAAAGAAGVAAGAAAAGASQNSPPPPADNVYRVQLDFKPSMEDELEIRAGQLVRMLHGYDDGWVSISRISVAYKSETLTCHRHSACAWIAHNKVSSHVPACPRTPSSLVKVLHHRVAQVAQVLAARTAQACAVHHHQVCKVAR